MEFVVTVPDKQIFTGLRGNPYTGNMETLQSHKLDSSTTVDLMDDIHEAAWSGFVDRGSACASLGKKARLLKRGDPLLLLVELLVDVCKVLGPIELLVADDVDVAARLLLVPVGAARIELESLGLGTLHVGH